MAAASNSIFHPVHRIPTSPISAPLLPPLRFPRRRQPIKATVKVSSSLRVRDGVEAVTDRRLVVESCYGGGGREMVVGERRVGGRDSGGGGTVVLEKSKAKKKAKAPELSTGDGGGDMGKKIFTGGGDGGGDGGDDDDYYDDFDEEEDGDDGGGLFRRRIILPELFGREFVNAVMSEWMKTITDLPAGIRQAYEMGLVSTAQMVNFLAMNARPTTERAISRILPQGMSRAFVGRMLADPAFLHRLLFEQVTTIGCSVWWELKCRKNRIKQEWDLALINVLTASACNAIVVWSLAPCRSYGNIFTSDLQNTLQKLPNNIFESNYHLREFDLQKRIHSFFYKAAGLCLVGMTSGAVQGGLSNLCASRKEHRVSMTIPSVSTNALGYGAFLGLYSNLRYQLLCGFDKTVTSYFDVIGVALCFSAAMRVLNVQLGETSRLAWLGVEEDPLASDIGLNVYERPSNSDSKNSAGWSLPKLGLGLVGINQGTSSEPQAPKPRRKKIIRRTVTASS